MAAPRETKPAAAAPTIRKRPRDPSSRATFENTLFSSRGLATFLEMVRRTHLICNTEDVPQRRRDLSSLIAGEATPVGAEAPLHHRKLDALMTVYYEWNHLTFMKLPLHETQYLLQRSAKTAINHLTELERIARLKERNKMNAMNSSAALPTTDDTQIDSEIAAVEAELEALKEDLPRDDAVVSGGVGVGVGVFDGEDAESALPPIPVEHEIVGTDGE